MIIKRQKIYYPSSDDNQVFEEKIFLLGILIYSNIELNDVSGQRLEINEDAYQAFEEHNNIDFSNPDTMKNYKSTKHLELIIGKPKIIIS